MMKVEIDNIHAEAIAAFYSGRRVRCYRPGSDTPGSWMTRDEHSHTFHTKYGYIYEIEPEVKVKYSCMYTTVYNGVVMTPQEFDTPEAAAESVRQQTAVGVAKKTYTDGVLTSLELIK